MLATTPRNELIIRLFLDTIDVKKVILLKVKG